MDGKRAYGVRRTAYGVRLMRQRRGRAAGGKVPAADRASRREPGAWVAAAALALVVGLAYSNSFRAALILDNVPIILQDPRLRAADWSSLGAILSRNYWWPTGDSNLYRPLTTLTYWVNYSLLGNGANPGGYHAVNLLLHWANALLAFLLVRSVSGRAWVALVAAAVFASHPLTVESVTNVVGRADLLAGVSILGGLCLYRMFLAAGTPRWPWLIALGLLYVAGVFSKESAVVLPALMLLHDVLFPLDRRATAGETLRRSAARAWPAYASLVPGVVLPVAARWAVFHEAPVLAQFGGDNPIVNAPYWTAVMTALKVAGYYLALFVWPARLSADYSYNAITAFGWTATTGQDLHAWVALACLGALAVVMVASWRRQPALAFFLGLAGITFLPASNLLVPIGTIMAERLMYVPLVGLAAAATIALELLGRRLVARRVGADSHRWARAGLVLAGALVAGLLVRTHVRNEDWTSSLRLWSSAALVVPESYKVHKALAFEVMQSDPSAGRVDEAIAAAERSIGIVERADLPLAQQPAGLYAEAGSYRLRKAQLLSARGSAGEAQAEIVQALTWLERAETIDREATRASRERLVLTGSVAPQLAVAGSAFIYRSLATAYLGAGQPLRAVTAAGHLQRIAPGHFDPHYMRGVTEAASAQFEEQRGNQRDVETHLDLAAVNLVAATLLNPAHRESWSLLSKVYGYLAPMPSAVIVSSDAPRLNMEHPVVAGHVRRAGAQLVAQLSAAGLERDATALRDRLARDFGLPQE